MQKRDVIRLVLEGRKPPYVPWSFGFTLEARAKLQAFYGSGDLEPLLQPHMLELGDSIGYFTDLGGGRVRDVFGVVWDRTVDKDIGNVVGCVLPEATLNGYEFPDPVDPRVFDAIDGKIGRRPDLFRVFSIGFSLYERAWTLRGMENLMMDFIEHPRFVHELLDRITECNMAAVGEALKHDIDAIHFGDDWGQQIGLQMGPRIWREFIKPCLGRMYGQVRRAGKFVSIHSCGDVDELFDELIEMGLNLFNPFQPEVMDVPKLLAAYRGRLAFHGGLSLQRTLPFGTPQDVRNETRRLIDLGRQGGYILSPSHAVQGDVPLENMLAFIDEARNQPGFLGGKEQ